MLQFLRIYCTVSILIYEPKRDVPLLAGDKKEKEEHMSTKKKMKHFGTTQTQTSFPFRDDNIRSVGNKWVAYVPWQEISSFKS